MRLRHVARPEDPGSDGDRSDQPGANERARDDGAALSFLLTMSGVRASRDPLQLPAKIACRLPTLDRLLGQASLDDTLQRRRGEWLQRGHGRRIGRQDRRNHAGPALPRERPAAGDHLMQHRTEGKEVSAAIDLTPFELLGRAVGNRAHDLTFCGHLQVCRCGFRNFIGFRLSELCQTEIQQLDAFSGQHDVTGLHVAVDDALLVGSVQSVADLDGISQGFIQRQGTVVQAVGECLPSRYSITRKAMPSCSPMS